MTGSSLKDKFKQALASYDKWQKEMGLTPEQGRCCAPRRQDPPLKQADEAADKAKSDQ